MAGYYDVSGKEIDVYDKDGKPLPPPKPSDPDVIRVKARRKKKKVIIEDDGDPTEPLPVPAGEYVLVELMADEKDAYVDMSLARTQRNDKGVAIAYTTKDLEAILVSKCLFTQDGKTFPYGVLAKLPASTLTMLYEEAEKLCVLDKLAADKAKKA